MTKHLKFDMYVSPSGHPQNIMKELGITYQYAIPHSLADCWTFWNCDNIPDSLPSFLTEIDIDPLEMVGHGLSLEMAQKIKKYGNKSTSI